MIWKKMQGFMGAQNLNFLYSLDIFALVILL